MSNDNPILNKPYTVPAQHYRTLTYGTLDYDAIVKEEVYMTKNPISPGFPLNDPT